MCIYNLKVVSDRIIIIAAIKYILHYISQKKKKSQISTMVIIPWSTTRLCKYNISLSGLMVIHKVLSFIGGQEEPTPGKMTFYIKNVHLYIFTSLIVHCNNLLFCRTTTTQVQMWTVCTVSPQTSHVPADLWCCQCHRPQNLSGG